MSYAEVRRRYKVPLDQIKRVKTMTEEGRSWFISAVDPFHDSDLRLAGYPDTATASTVIQLVKKQFTVASPFAPEVPWDCRLQLTPTSTCLSGGTGELTTGGFLNNIVSAGGDLFVGGMQADAVPSTSGNFAPLNTSVRNVGRADISQYAKGAHRIIGMAFEVINTTSTMSRQGTCTVFRQPSTLSDDFVYNDDSPRQAVSLRLYRAAPDNQQDALLLYGSRAWDASEGCYSVARLNSTNVPFRQPTHQTVAGLTDDIAAGTSSRIVIPNAAGYPGTPQSVYPFDTTGAFFSGLSGNTTLTVTVRWLVERVPTSTEADLVVLAQPSTCYDPVALELYSRALCHMPPGVMLCENPFGEWFRRIMAQVSDWAPKVGGALGTIVPFAKPVGEIVGYVAGKASGTGITKGSASSTVDSVKLRQQQTVPRLYIKQ